MEIATLTGHSNAVSEMVVSPNGAFVVSSAWDKAIRVWDIETATCRSALLCHGDGPAKIALTPDGKRIVAGSFNGLVTIWDLESGERVARFAGEGPVMACAVAPNGKLIAVGDASGRVHFLGLEGIDVAV